LTDPKKQKNNIPVLYDTDYGPFIDDVFGLGLILNSADLLDLKYIIATSEDADLSSKCVAKHLDLAGFSNIPVGSGQVLPPHSERGSVGAIPGLVGFALESKCGDVDLPYDKDGVLEAANMIMESKRDDWWYIIVGGQSSAKALIERFPEAAKKIETVVIMGGNWCSGFEPYPNVMAPTDETNIGYDPHAANFILDSSVSPFKNIYYVPVEVADIISGQDYMKFVEAANSGSNKGAAVTLDFYREWSDAGRSNPDILVHLEAMAYDPVTQSTPQFDPCAIMLALELLNKDCEDRLVLVEIDGVRFMEAGEGVAFPDSPRPAFSLLPKSFEMDKLPEQCPALTPYSFDPAETVAVEKRVSVALGYKSAEAKASFFAEMAARMAGEKIDKCI
jgi:inosine-uridine nucleoside N-ribohydrolase